MTALQFPAVSLNLLGARLGERAEGVSLMWLVSWDLFTWALSFTTQIACPFCQLVFFLAKENISSSEGRNCRSLNNQPWKLSSFSSATFYWLKQEIGSTQITKREKYFIRDT